MTQRELFLQHVAPTSSAPLCFEIESAHEVYLTDISGKQYIDLIGGISVCNVGHTHPDVVAAIEKQIKQYMHVMVYGEVIQSPQVKYATQLATLLPSSLQSVYFTNSGSEATEGAMKLAKRFTQRTKIISATSSYHGSTQGALSVMGSEYWQQAYRPLLPDVFQYAYGSQALIDAIDNRTACVIIELVQSEAGVIIADNHWLMQIRTRCTETGALLIIDEIQTGFGRTGTLFRFQATPIIPDILLLGKALGGGMPMGAFIASVEMMQVLSYQPVLGHITTFGGHPVCCSAGLAALQVLLQSNWIQSVEQKSKIFKQQLIHPAIKQVNCCGLLIAVEFDNFEINKKIIDQCIVNGVFTDWFLFASNCLRIAPPLCISEAEIITACNIIIRSINEMVD